MADPRTTHSRSEVVSTIALLADKHDFAAMRRYSSFPFTDHARYLNHVDDLLRNLAAKDGHISVTLFDPEDFADFCADTGIDPDDATSRAHYTADCAATGPRTTYTGQPLIDLIHTLVDNAVRHATHEFATMLLNGAGSCPGCDQDLGEMAVTRASSLLLRLLGAAGPGTNRLVCSVPAVDEQLLAEFHAIGDSTSGTAHGADDDIHIRTVLAVGLLLGSRGGLVLRTVTPDAPDRLHGWSLSHGRLHPLTEAEVFNAYCTDARTGEPISPESGVEYRAGFPLAPDNHAHA
ncbi:hypothetical protein ACWECC_11580 [Streptomyces microflavus]